MQGTELTNCVAFSGTKRVALDALPEVVRAVKAAMAVAPDEPVLVFEASTSMPVEVDWRGSVDDVLARLPHGTVAEAAKKSVAAVEPEPAAPRGPGRPKLGVVAREVTLLPRHWEWLAAQPGGASVALRKLVEQARRANAAKDDRRKAQESAYRFMVAMAGNETGFDDAARALFAGDVPALTECVAPWPNDIRDHLLMLAARA